MKRLAAVILSIFALALFSAGTTSAADGSYGPWQATYQRPITAPAGVVCPFTVTAELSTVLARKRVVGEVREALAENPRTGVIELARRVAISPHHLSRVFRAETERQSRATATGCESDWRWSGWRRASPASPVSPPISASPTRHLARIVRQELGATPSLPRERLATT